MSSTTLWIIIGVVVLVALYLYNRSRPAPRGTYNDPNFNSSGSIGGGPQAHNDPNFSSSGSIGGGPQAHNDPNFGSSGSIGGHSSTERKDEPAKPTHDDPNFKSGGSFGT